MGKYFYFLLVCAFFVLISSTGCTKSGSITGATKIKDNGQIVVSADKGSMKSLESATVSVTVSHADGSLLAGGACTLTEGGNYSADGAAWDISVTFSSNSNGSVSTASDSHTFAGCTETTPLESASSFTFTTTVTATSTGILTVSSIFVNYAVSTSVDITVVAVL